MRLRFLIGITLFAVVVGIGFAAYQARKVLTEVPSPPPLLGNYGTPSQSGFHKQLTLAEKQHILDGEFVIVANTKAMPTVV